MSACVSLRFLRKNNERLLGTEMKKLVILLLVFALLGLTGCGLFGKNGASSKAVSSICEIANKSKPTKISTDVNYVTKAGDTLLGHYVTTTDGTDAIFEYYYENLATPAESLENGTTDRIIAYEGVIKYKDGSYYSGDEEQWKPGTGTAFDLKFSIDEKKLKDIAVSDDGFSFDAKVSVADLKEFIGTELNAVGDATLTVSVNGANLTGITVSCSTPNGDIVIRTSYTYNPQDLFPDAEEGV